MNLQVQPDIIDMMSEEELRIELKKLIETHCGIKNLYFDVGAIISLGLLAGIQGSPFLASDLIKQMGLQNADISEFGISEYDQENIDKINKEGCNIKY
jgi:hypothetical protein